MFDDKTLSRQRWIATVWAVLFSVMIGGGIYNKTKAPQTIVAELVR